MYFNVETSPLKSNAPWPRTTKIVTVIFFCNFIFTIIMNEWKVPWTKMDYFLRKPPSKCTMNHIFMHDTLWIYSDDIHVEGLLKKYKQTCISLLTSEKAKSTFSSRLLLPHLPVEPWFLNNVCCIYFSGCVKSVFYIMS